MGLCTEADPGNCMVVRDGRVAMHNPPPPCHYNANGELISRICLVIMPERLYVCSYVQSRLKSVIIAKR